MIFVLFINQKVIIEFSIPQIFKIFFFALSQEADVTLSDIHTACGVHDDSRHFRNDNIYASFLSTSGAVWELDVFAGKREKRNKNKMKDRMSDAHSEGDSG